MGDGVINCIKRWVQVANLNPQCNVAFHGAWEREDGYKHDEGGDPIMKAGKRDLSISVAHFYPDRW